MSQTLDTALGLVSIFALSALFCSAIVEAIAVVFERRAKYLITALRNMLDEPESGISGKRAPGLKPAVIHRMVKTPQGARELAAVNLSEHATYAVATGRNRERATTRWKRTPLLDVGQRPNVIEGQITASLFLHPLIRGLQTRTVRLGFDGRIRNPQYIPAATFTRALIGTFLPEGSRPNDPNMVQDLREVVASLPDSFEARRSLLTLIDQADNNIRTLQKSIEEWYDAQMGRISGWYKRWTQVILLGVGLIFAMGLNIDTLQIGHTLWVNEPVRTAVLASATNGTLCRDAESDEAKQECALKALSDFDVAGVPIGPPPGCSVNTDGLALCVRTAFGPDNILWATLLKLCGWLVTAGAISFGAPFWFEALSKLGSLRSSGPKPPAEETT